MQGSATKIRPPNVMNKQKNSTNGAVTLKVIAGATRSYHHNRDEVQYNGAILTVTVLNSNLHTAGKPKLRPRKYRKN